VDVMPVIPLPSREEMLAMDLTFEKERETPFGKVITRHRTKENRNNWSSE